MEQDILYKNEIVKYLNLPSIPKKEWDGKSPFEKSIAIVKTYTGSLAYAVASFNPEKDSDVRIVKTFSQEVFNGIEKVLIVPSYMDVDVESFDLDSESKKNAERIVNEASDIENKDARSIPDINELPEWIFDEIHSREEANAWLRAYNKRNKIRGDVPKKDETVKLRLYAIYIDNIKKK